MTLGALVLTEHVSEALDHLIGMVQQHEADFGEDGQGAITFGWDVGGWWLSICCPGHYAFEQEDREFLHELVAEAMTYYGTSMTLWHSHTGCRQHHPLAGHND